MKVLVLSDGPDILPESLRDRKFICPKDYVPKLGKARYKARALEYFRCQANLTELDWVLHMDEEATTDSLTLKSCFDLIRYVSNVLNDRAHTY